MTGPAKNNQKKEVEITYTGKATAEQIATWKKEHGDDVFSVELNIGNNEKSVCYFKPPNRHHIAAAMTCIHRDQIVEAGEALLDATWLGGDLRCKSLEDKDTKFRVGVAVLLRENTTVLEAAIKNV